MSRDIQELTDWMEFSSSEDLHPDLADHVEQYGDDTVLHHPFVILPFYAPQMNQMANVLYEQKRRAAVAALRGNEWGSYVFLHERPYRMQAFLEIAEDLPNDEYWSLLRQMWTDTENFYFYRDAWIELLSRDVPGFRQHFMDDDERQKFDSLPSVVKAYRGVSSAEGFTGLSWSFDRSKALWFAKRYGGVDDPESVDGPKGYVLTAEVPKSAVMACVLSRSEDEAIINLEGIQTVPQKNFTHYTRQEYDADGNKVGRKARLALDSHEVPAAARRGLALAGVVEVELHYADGHSIAFRRGHQ